jgi:hypothetical protein
MSPSGILPSMPEIAVDKNTDFPFGKNNIGLSLYGGNVFLELEGC